MKKDRLSALQMAALLVSLNCQNWFDDKRKLFNVIILLKRKGFFKLSPRHKLKSTFSNSSAVFNQPSSRRHLSLSSINGLPSIANKPYNCTIHKLFLRSKTNRYWVSCRVFVLLKIFFLNIVLYVQPILLLETGSFFLLYRMAGLLSSIAFGNSF